MDGGNSLGLRDTQQIIVAPEIARPVGKPLAPEIGLGEMEVLHAGAQGAIQNRDAPVQQRPQPFGALVHAACSARRRPGLRPSA